MMEKIQKITEQHIDVEETRILNTIVAAYHAEKMSVTDFTNATTFLRQYSVLMKRTLKGMQNLEVKS